jgi:16S rRNA G1207 methylase RsmC
MSDPKPRNEDDTRLALRAGGVNAACATELFATPMALARRMAALANPQPGDRMLEPSAGSGNLLRALAELTPFASMKQRACEVVAVESNLAFRESLANEQLGQRVIGGDFLECTPEDLGRFDVILMNPPFANGSDIAHVLHAQRFLAPGARLVAICSDGPRQREQLSELGEYESLPEGSFASVGLEAATAMLVIRA